MLGHSEGARRRDREKAGGIRCARPIGSRVAGRLMPKITYIPHGQEEITVEAEVGSGAFAFTMGAWNRLF